MAQAKRKRRRKHRGTPAGTVARPTRSAHTKKEDPKQAARQRRQERMDRPPTWRGAVNRAAIAAVLFGVLIVLLFDRPIGLAVVYTVFVFLLYIPLGYGTDKLLYNFRQRRKASR